MEINSVSLEKALEVLGQILDDRKLHYEVVAIGGGSLLLLGLIERSTKDLDIVALIREKALHSASPLPFPLIQAANEVGLALDLGKEWFNIGPASLLDSGFPPGFIHRLHIRKYKGLTVYLADRFDQICFKLYASVYLGPTSKHFTDLRSLIPTLDELLQAKNWCLTQDGSADFEEHLNQAIEQVNGSN